MTIKNRPTMLMILDGYGLNSEKAGNAIAKAKKPNIDRIFAQYPNTRLGACGMDVGLPEGQMGNSEVGHLNIGAGRIIYQELTNITNHIDDGSFFENEALKTAMNHVKKEGSTLHLMGLLSDGGVHSHISHLFALIDMAKKEGIEKLYVHCFLDGRDVPPRCSLNYINSLNEYMKKQKLGEIGVISGRYYAMDRDKRWERVVKAYDALTLGEGRHKANPNEAIKDSYSQKIDDEFVVPVIIDKDCAVSDNDAVIMYNFRPDRAREITHAFTDTDFEGFERKKKIDNLCYVCMTEYEAGMENVLVAYPPERYENTLGEYVSGLGLSQLRIAETEKYAHVTFFFNGGVEEPNPGEDRLLIPSPKVATYDLQPEMSAYQVTDSVIEAIESDKYDLIILNFANADMVGHTGVMDAAVKAIEALDVCIEKIKDAVLAKDGVIFLTADHGNADTMVGPHDEVITSHSLNPVPFVHIANEPCDLRDGGRLADIAPTLLDFMGIDIPPEMTGTSLLKKLRK